MARPSRLLKCLGLLITSWLALPPLLWYNLPFPADHSSAAALDALESKSFMQRTYSLNHFYPDGHGIASDEHLEQDWPYFVLDVAYERKSDVLWIGDYAVNLARPELIDEKLLVHVAAAVPQLIYKESWPPGDVVPLDAAVRSLINTDEAYANVHMASRVVSEGGSHILELYASNEDEEEPVESQRLLSLSWRADASGVVLSDISVPGPELAWAPSKLYQARLIVLFSWAGIVPALDVLGTILNPLWEVVCALSTFFIQLGVLCFVVWVVWWYRTGRPPLEEAVASMNRATRSPRVERWTETLRDMRLEGTRINVFVAYEIWQQTPSGDQDGLPKPRVGELDALDTRAP